MTQPLLPNLFIYLQATNGLRASRKSEIQVELAACTHPDLCLGHRIRILKIKRKLALNAMTRDLRPTCALNCTSTCALTRLPSASTPVTVVSYGQVVVKHNNYGALEPKMYEKPYVCSPVFVP